MKDKIKNNVVIIIIAFIIIAFLGIAYAWYVTYRETGTSTLIAGDIYFNLIDGNESINLTGAVPELTSEARNSTIHIEGTSSSNTMTFTVEGDNPTARDLYYQILLNYGDDVENKIRFYDDELVFDLIEIDENGDPVGDYLVNAKSYLSIDKQMIYFDKVNANTENYSKRYQLRMWISNDVLISDTNPNRDYTETGDNAFSKHFASVKVGVLGSFNEIGSDYLYNKVKANAVIDNVNNVSHFINNSPEGIKLSAISSDTNGKGVYQLASSKDDEYPIYYYRGAVEDNNVYFAGYCWKIVRTTDTGGVKLIYAGVPTSDATHDVICNNTGDAAQLASTSAFNTNYNSPAYVGYMYGKVYGYSNGQVEEGTYFGTGVSYNGSVYTLKGAKVGIDNDHHYTCNLTTAEGTCSSVRYYYYYNGDYGDNHDKYYMYITLNGEADIYEALDKMRENTTSSNAKAKIDEWYALKMRDYTNKLEDVIWCNDREIYSYGGWNPSGGRLTDYLYYEGVRRRDITRVANLGCINKRDAFTVNNKKGNKSLTYPVGLLTMDEIMLAGGQAAANSSYYLYTGKYYWSLSPSYFDINYALEFYVFDSGGLYNDGVGSSLGLRPSVSLRPGTVIDKGNGTGNNPYIIS